MTQNDPQSQLPTFGAYRTIRRIGRGGFADVYLVEGQPHLLYAVKQIKREKIAEDPKFRERFERETSLQASLRHPHVVRIFNYDVEQGYLVMEYAEGGTLRAFLDDEYPNGVDLQTALTFLQEIGSALTYLHERLNPLDEQQRGIAHLDLKPQNILIQTEPDPTDPSGGNKKRFLVADFSMAHQLSHTGKPQGGTSINDGTARYMAPEQAEPEKWGRAGLRSDIYSLGVILYEMLCGRQPPIGRPPRPLRELKTDIPREVEEVIQRATAENPEERYGSVKGFVRAFADAVAHADRSTQAVSNAAAEQRNDPPGPGITGRLKKNVVVVSRRSLVGVMGALLGLIIVWTLVQNLPVTHWTSLGGFDLGTYCSSLGYEANSSDQYCFSTITLTKACDWQYSRSDLRAGSNPSNPGDSLDVHCYTPQGSDQGGMSQLDNYCKDPRQGYHGTPVVNILEHKWICESKIDATLVCMWEYNRTDVLARKNDQGFWECDALF